jgi:NAD(P)-dependent dehydrogenase (short-subunit alcohol dehydrogenase family)
MKTEGRVVLITGASRGIGKAVAGMFARQGDRIAVHYHADRAGAEDTLAGLPGNTHKIFQADLARPEEAQRLVEEVLHAMERIDVLVNNAGMFAQHPIAETGFHDWVSIWERTLNTNLLGAAHASYCAARAMMRQEGGKIINISSRGAFRGEPDAPAYGASKAGMNAMSQSLSKALAPYGIMVYAIAPGWVATDMAAPYLEGVEGDEVRSQSPLGRVADPDEIARTALFLASQGTDYLTGCIIDVNGASYLRT